MPATVTDVSTLNIHRLHARYLVHCDHPSPEAVRAKLDGIARRVLRDAVAAAVSRSLLDSAADIWLIRSLKLEVDLNLDASEQQLALTWAKQTANSLDTILDGHADADEVLHFPNRAAYLARFLLDLVEGLAWDKWYYRNFEGLRQLPLSAALRTAICHHSTTGRNALLQMSEPSLRRVLVALADYDAKRILYEIAEESTSNQALIPDNINPRLLRQPLPFENEYSSALSIYLRVCSEYPAVAGPKLKAFVLAATCLARCMRDGPSSWRDKLVHSLSTSDLASLYQLSGAADAARLTPLLGRTAEWVQAVGKPVQIASHAPENIDELRHTAAGGIFLLLPLLDAMPIAEAALGWPEICKCQPAALVRFLLLMKCFGTAGAIQLFRDSLIRHLLGITPDLDPPSLRKWQTSLSLKQLFSLQNEIVRWQMENWIESQRLLTLVACPKQRSLLCFEHHHRSLLLALPDSRRSRPLLLDKVSALTADQAMAMANPDEPAAAADVQVQQPRSLPSPAHELFGPPMDEAHFQQILDDLDFLKLPSSLRGPRRCELTFSLAARALLRNFSWRLPGFSQSGLHYLHRNFLDLPASVQNHAAQRTVRLGQPPLHVVLSLSGMTRQRYCLSWTEGTFALFPE